MTLDDGEASLKTTFRFHRNKSGVNFCLMVHQASRLKIFLALKTLTFTREMQCLKILLSSVSLSKPKKQGNLA
jgi:hypothetical protein